MDTLQLRRRPSVNGIVPSGRSRDGVEMIDTISKYIFVSGLAEWYLACGLAVGIALWQGLKWVMGRDRLVTFKDRPTCELDMTEMFNEMCERLFRTYPSGWDYEQFRARITTKLYKAYVDGDIE